MIVSGPRSVFPEIYLLNLEIRRYLDKPRVTNFRVRQSPPPTGNDILLPFLTSDSMKGRITLVQR